MSRLRGGRLLALIRLDLVVQVLARPEAMEERGRLGRRGSCDLFRGRRGSRCGRLYGGGFGDFDRRRGGFDGLDGLDGLDGRGLGCLSFDRGLGRRLRHDRGSFDRRPRMLPHRRSRHRSATAD